MKSIRWFMASILGVGLAWGVLWLLDGQTVSLTATPVLGKAVISEGRPLQAPRWVRGGIMTTGRAPEEG